MSSVVSNTKDTAEQAANTIKQTGASMAHKVMDVGAQLIRLYNQMDIGFERRSSIVPVAMSFAAGAVIGGGVALMLTPNSGRELRHKLASLLRQEGDKVATVEKAVEAEGLKQGNGHTNPA